MKKKTKYSRFFALSLFAFIFVFGSMYMNCGSVNEPETSTFSLEEEGVRQKVFIDEVHDIYPEGTALEQKPDGSYELDSVNLED